MCQQSLPTLCTISLHHLGNINQPVQPADLLGPRACEKSSISSVLSKSSPYPQSWRRRWRRGPLPVLRPWVRRCWSVQLLHHQLVLQLLHHQRVSGALAHLWEATVWSQVVLRVLYARLWLCPWKAVALLLVCLVVTPLTVSRRRSMTTRRQSWLLGMHLASFQNCSASNIIVNTSLIRTVLSPMIIFRWAIKIAGGCYFCKGIFKLLDLHDTGWNVFSIFTMRIWEILEGCTLTQRRWIRKNQFLILIPLHIFAKWSPLTSGNGAQTIDEVMNPSRTGIIKLWGTIKLRWSKFDYQNSQDPWSIRHHQLQQQQQQQQQQQLQWANGPWQFWHVTII